MFCSLRYSVHSAGTVCSVYSVWCFAQILTFLPLDHIVRMMDDCGDSDSELAQSLSYLLHNEADGRAYLRDCCANGFSQCDRNVVWPFLVCHSFEMAQYHALYEAHCCHVDFFHHPIIEKDIDRTLINSGTQQSGHLPHNRNHDVLSDANKRKLKTILSIYAMLDPEIGYIQGMNYIWYHLSQFMHSIA